MPLTNGCLAFEVEQTRQKWSSPPHMGPATTKTPPTPRIKVQIIEKGKEEPIKVSDHCMDAIRYMVMGMWTKIKAWLPVSEQDDEK